MVNAAFRCKKARSLCSLEQETTIHCNGDSAYASGTEVLIESI